MKNKVLVTGASGGIGFSLVNRLAKEGYHVVALDRRITRKFLPEVETVECDLATLGDDKLFEGIGYIFHLACIKPSQSGTTKEEYFENIKMTDRVGSLNKEAKVIYPSAGTIYGNVDRFPIKETEEIKCQEEDYYCRSKLESENILQQYSEKKHFPLVILRITNVYGPDFKREGEILPNFYNAIMKNQPVIIYGDGEQKRDRIWIDDLIDAFILSMKDGVNGIFNIGSEESFSTNRVAEIMGTILHKDKLFFSYEPIDESKTLRANNLLDISKAKEVMGFSPKISFEKGLRLLAEEWQKSLS